mgnify:CR=1 FL=1
MYDISKSSILHAAFLSADKVIDELFEASVITMVTLLVFPAIASRVVDSPPSSLQLLLPEIVNVLFDPELEADLRLKVKIAVVPTRDEKASLVVAVPAPSPDAICNELLPVPPSKSELEYFPDKVQLSLIFSKDFPKSSLNITTLSALIIPPPATRATSRRANFINLFICFNVYRLLF